METRFRKRCEDLQNELKALGLFEDGMELQEMSELLEAVKESAITEMDYEAEENIERALRASELEFLPLDDELHNSTMISNNPQNTAHVVDYPFYNGYYNQFSPPAEGSTFTIQADVHHEMNWVPPVITEDAINEDYLKRKRNSNCNYEQNSKRIQIDSGIHTSSELITYLSD